MIIHYLYSSSTLRNRKESSTHKKYTSVPVTLGFNPTRHPNMFARSPTIAVNNPIIPRDTKKHGHPPHIPAGGINAKMI